MCRIRRTRRALIDPAFPEPAAAAQSCGGAAVLAGAGLGRSVERRRAAGRPRIGNAGIRNPNVPPVCAARRLRVAVGVEDGAARRIRLVVRPADDRAGSERVRERLRGRGGLPPDQHQHICGDSTVNRISPRIFGAIDESSNAVPTVYDFSLSIQRAAAGVDMVLDVAYIGNMQRHQPM